MTSGYNYGGYTAPSHQHHGMDQHYGGYQNATSSQPSSLSGYQPSVISGSQPQSFLSRYQYQTPNSDHSVNSSGNPIWYGNGGDEQSYGRYNGNSNNIATAADGVNSKYPGQYGNSPFGNSYHSKQQSHPSRPQYPPTHVANFQQNVYGQQHARPDSVNSTTSDHSGQPAGPSADQPRPSYGNYQQQQQQQPPVNRAKQYHQYPQSPQSQQSPVFPSQQASSQSRSSGNATTTGSHVSARQQHYGPTSTEQSNQDTRQRQSQQQQDGQSSLGPTVPVTVDPTQVLNPMIDFQRQAAKGAEAEVLRKTEEEARRKGELDAEKAHWATREAHDSGQAKKPTSSTKPRKPRKRTQQATASPPVNDADANAAAMTLLQTANASGNSSADLENQMRAMFSKMREFNKKDPSLLAKLWQEEHDTHMAQQQASKKTTPKGQGRKQSDGSPPADNQSLPSKKNQATGKANPKAASPSRTQRDIQTNGAGTQASPAQVLSESASKLRKNTLSDHAPSTPAQVFGSSKPKLASSTMWPADKKASLASAAASFISKAPGNAGKSIDQQGISSILDTNPSYVELCVSIESKGFQLDRSAFAKSLMSAVPAANKKAGASSSAQINGNAPSSSTAIQENAEARLMSARAVVETPKRIPNRKSTTETSQLNTSPTTGALRDTNANNLQPAQDDAGLEGLSAVKKFVDHGEESRSNSSAPRESKASRSKQSRQSQPQMQPTKEESARKRTFADLVDLTAQLSDDEEEPPSKRLAGGNENVAIPNDSSRPSLDTPQVDSTPATVPSASLSNVQPPSQLQIYETQPPTMTPTRPSGPPPIPFDHPVRSVLVVEPLERKRALRRSHYNPKTIARDVLLATGRHPEMQNLNAHLNTLRQAFAAHGMQQHPGVDLTTFRWDIVDPGGPPPGAGAQLLGDDLVEDADLGFEADADDSDDNDSILGPSPSRPIVVNGISQNSAAACTAPAHPLPGQKRIGRPWKHSQLLRTANSATPDTKNPPSSLPNHKGRPHGRPSGGGGGDSNNSPSAYAALRESQSAQGSGAAKRGRPVGWRKWMQKTPSGGGGGDKPTKNKPPPPEPEPRYQIYKCGWAKTVDGRDAPCGAELHNLATLRKHVFKLHGQREGDGGEDNPQGQLPCHWVECAKVVADRQGPRVTSRLQPLLVAEERAWRAHIESEHLRPIAWDLGDGPAGGVSSANESELSDAYLSDANGRRVTPRAELPRGGAVEAAAKSSAPPVVTKLGRGMNRGEEAAVREWSEGERRGRLGPGIDREGARFVNEKRRMGFVDGVGKGTRVVDTDE